MLAGFIHKRRCKLILSLQKVPCSMTVHLSPLLSSEPSVVFIGFPYQDPRQMKVFVTEGWLRVSYFLCIVLSLFIVWLSRSFFQPEELFKLKEKLEKNTGQAKLRRQAIVSPSRLHARCQVYFLHAPSQPAVPSAHLSLDSCGLAGFLFQQTARWVNSYCFHYGLRQLLSLQF